MTKSPANKIDTSELLNDLRRVKDKTNKIPTIREYSQHGHFDPVTLFNRFGSYNEAKRLAFGSAVKPYRLSKEEVLLDLLSVRDKIGRIPSKTEYAFHGKYTLGAIVPRFASWNEALKEIFGTTRQLQHGPQSIMCEECGQCCKKTPCQIQQSKHHFCSLSCSSRFAQKHKIKGINKSRLEEYLREYLAESFSNLEIKYNNRSEIGLELDIFIPKLQLAFEINGIFHYKPVFGLPKLVKIQNNDRKKQTLCVEKNIHLHVIDVSGMNVFKTHMARSFAKRIALIIRSEYSLQKTT